VQVCGRHNGSHDERRGEICEALKEAAATVNVEDFDLEVVRW
jgi:hypothetical protein